MNIFVTSSSPKKSAIVLPDKHIVKMPLECCQMLSIVASDKWGHGYGELHRLDGQPYRTEKGAFRNHPCTKWASESIHNSYWLIKHGLHMCHEYFLRYDKVHSCYKTPCRGTGHLFLRVILIRSRHLYLLDLMSSSMILWISTVSTNVHLI